MPVAPGAVQHRHHSGNKLIVDKHPVCVAAVPIFRISEATSEPPVYSGPLSALKVQIRPYLFFNKSLQLGVTRHSKTGPFSFTFCLCFGGFDYVLRLVYLEAFLLEHKPFWRTFAGPWLWRRNWRFIFNKFGIFGSDRFRFGT